MNKKGEFDFRSYLIGIILVMGVLVTFAMSYSSMASTYGISTESASAFNSTYNKLASIDTFTSEQNEQLLGSKLNEDSTNLEFWGNMLSIGKKIYSLITLPISMLNDVFETIPLPPIWKDIAIMLIIVLFVTAFIFMVFQSRG